MWRGPVMVALLAPLLWGCASERFWSETCRQERQRSKQMSSSSFCPAASGDAYALSAASRTDTETEEFLKAAHERVRETLGAKQAILEALITELNAPTTGRSR